jgi:chorismate synthase
MGSIFGTRFTVTTFGESHGAAIGAVIDGCPSLLELSPDDIQVQMDRRRPGQSRLTTQRKESDTVEILSGVENGKTLGTPIGLLIRNTDQKKGDYSEVANAPRPSHADLAYQLKYGIQASSGGGRASARETAARVAAGAVAEKWLRVKHGVDIVAWVSSVCDLDAPDLTDANVTRAQVDANIVRCPDPETADKMEDLIARTAREGDSLGGIVTCVCRGLPAGWGEPIFDKLDAVLAHAVLSLPATKGFELGSGFRGTRLRGSQHNDSFVAKSGRLGTVTNRSGGLQGGITIGEPIVFRVAFKPTATIRKAQESADYEGNPITYEITKGRHDPCVLPRAVPIVEAMTSLVLADMALIAASYG